MMMILPPHPSRKLAIAAFRQKLQRPLRSLMLVCLAIAIALGIIVVQPQVSSARPSFRDLLLQGIQLMQLSSISDQQEISLGQQINQELLDEKQIKLYTDPNINKYINQIGQRLVAKSQRPSLPFVFQVVEDKGINAFATMGGYVYVNTGLIQFADNEAQLASVIGHEIGHIVARHSIRQLRQTAITRGLASAAGLERSTIVKLGTEFAVRRRSSRQHELEADQLGFEDLTQAGYAPGAMVDFFRKLMSVSQGSRGLTILSTHPATPDRAATLEAKLTPATAYQGDGTNTQAYKVAIKPL